MDSPDNDFGVTGMKFLTKPKWIYGLLITCCLSFTSSVLAGDPLITRHFSGVWDQPEQESQGILLQIGEQDGDEKVGIAYWFTYGEDLQTTWFFAVGPVTGNEINMKLYTAFNIAFMEEGVEGDANVEEVGTLDLVFRNCNHGTATFVSPEDVIGSGEFPIKRISSIYRTRCSGGISDDTPSDRKPEQLEVRLHPATEDGAGEGKAKFWERPDRTDFKVEAEGITDGSYSLKVCEDVVGDLLVSAGEGELAFRSPAQDGILEMTFDPRDCKIDLLSGDSVILTSGDAVLSEKENGKKDKEDKEGIEIEIDLDNTGIIDGAKGEAEYEIYADEREFSIKIKDVPAGSYTARVGGDDVGGIEVVEDDGEFEGKIKFKDPVREDGLALDFDPRGQQIEILNADAVVILNALFPDV
jgi:hypothetical protein